ncbi:MAG TPA: hypothetical protein VGH16_10195 [Candidatus Binatia bacterium]|jgi:hypothetical protein
MVITLIGEFAKFFFTLTAGLYAVVALILLIYLPFCIADCLRQRWGMARWGSRKQLGPVRNPEAAAPLPTAVPLPR